MHSDIALITSYIAHNTWLRSIIIIMIFACFIVVLSLKTISNQSQIYKKGLQDASN